MSYTALYRKFRPTTFEEVKGQDHIVTTVKNQLRAGRIGHAYLFCGTRGTGKTTIAKIFAKAVNCEHPVDGSPCGECPTCKAIAAGTSMNVIEIDAASNNGVDNIREIREEVAYRPTEGKYKVYIIDEVHMLSAGAFNALLKTLEEPPSYVIFILATTEVYKIPITILSRCQRYDFHRISIDTITARLSDILKAEGVQAEEKAVRYVAKAGDGSMRDSLSLLDQCIAFYLGQELTYDKVLEVLGAVDTEVFSRMLREIIAGNILNTLSLLERLVIEGKELSQFVNEFTWYLRNLLLVKSSDDMEDVLDISSENLALLKEEAQMIEPEVLMRYIRIFSDLSNQVKYSSQKRILIEIALIKLCKPEMESTGDALVDRIARLEQKMAEGIPVAAVPQAAGVSVQTEVPQKRPEIPKAIPEDVEQVVRNWKSLVQDMSGLIRGYLRQVTLSLGGDNVLLLVTDDTVAADILNTPEHRAEISDTIADHIGREVEIKIEQNQTNRPITESYVDLSQVINMDIEIEEDE